MLKIDKMYYGLNALARAKEAWANPWNFLAFFG